MYFVFGVDKEATVVKKRKEFLSRANDVSALIDDRGRFIISISL
jgi:hypothetical protein